MAMEAHTIATGRPAEYGQEIVKRRFRLTAARLNLMNKIVLDFGCGNGAQTAEFLGSGCKMIAVDIGFHELRSFAAYLDQGVLTSALPVQYDGDHLPLPAESVDVVLTYEVIEHVRDES